LNAAILEFDTRYAFRSKHCRCLRLQPGQRDGAEEAAPVRALGVDLLAGALQHGGEDDLRHALLRVLLAAHGDLREQRLAGLRGSPEKAEGEALDVHVLDLDLQRVGARPQLWRDLLRHVAALVPGVWRLDLEDLAAVDLASQHVRPRLKRLTIVQ